MTVEILGGVINGSIATHPAACLCSRAGSERKAVCCRTVIHSEPILPEGDGVLRGRAGYRWALRRLAADGLSRTREGVRPGRLIRTPLVGALRPHLIPRFFHEVARVQHFLTTAIATNERRETVRHVR